MRTKSIKVDGKETASSIRVSNKTRQMLSSLAKGQETQEEIILRLIKLANNLSTKEGTKIIEKGNVIGTKYEQKHKDLEVELRGKKYSVVCTFNDLSIIPILQNRRHIEQNLEWELELEIVNINNGFGWVKPSTLNIEEIRLIYLVCLKQILEETFDIKLYELVTEKDYLDTSLWADAYNRNNLSRDSLNVDVKNAFLEDLKERLR